MMPQEAGMPSFPGALQRVGFPPAATAPRLIPVIRRSGAAVHVLMQRDFEMPNAMLAFGAALATHVMLFMWNPILLPAGQLPPPPPLMHVEFRDALPPVVKPIAPKPVVKPVAKKKAAKAIQKKAVKKAKKAGLTLSAKSHHVAAPVKEAAPIVKAMPKPKPVIAIPHYVPHSADDDIVTASRPQTLSAPVVRHAAPGVLSAPHKLIGKTRGVKISDVRFELAESGTLTDSARSGSPVVAIPLGEESGDTAVLPSAPALHQSPHGQGLGALAARHHPGLGAGAGELSGRQRAGYSGGVIRADAGITSSDGGLVGSGSSKGHAGAAGPDIAGPVGDRGISKKVLPEYPDWAEEKGISSLVKIYFTVRADGSVRSNVEIRQSSGYAELDDLAKDALRKWKFQPTEDSSSDHDAWGIITFRFTLG